jgi:hypothetical protein
LVFFALLAGVILVVAAIRNTYPTLFAALGEDTPAFVIWAAAIVAVGVLGFVPAIKAPAKLLIALIILVLVLTNYQKILTGLAHAAQPGGGASSPGGASAQKTSASTSDLLSSLLSSAIGGTGGTNSGFAASLAEIGGAP